MRKSNVRSKSKKIISLATLASVCCTIPFVCSQTNANAGILGRFFGGARSIINSSRLSTTGSLTNNNIRGGLGSRRLSAASSISSVNTGDGNANGLQSPQIVRTGSKTSVVSPQNKGISELSSRIDVLETQQKIEAGRASHPFNKLVVGSGLVASAAMVAGVVGGIIQQSKFTNFTKEQTEKDQKVQEDINDMKQVFQKQEVPEAEQYIIDYYKKNFGIDITNQ